MCFPIFGFLQTPYRIVHRTMNQDNSDLIGRTVRQDVVDKNGKTVIKSGGIVSKGIQTRISKLPDQTIEIEPYVSSTTDDITYLTADDEENVHIAQATAPLDNLGQFSEDIVETRIGDGVSAEPAENISYMDVSPMQLVSVSTSLITFLESDDANRALMGSNMQRQAVPLLKPQAPLVGTGLEARVAIDSGQVILSKSEGVVTEASGKKVVVTDSNGNEHEHSLRKFVRSNQGTCINQRSVVEVGDIVQENQPFSVSSSTNKL